MHPRAQELISQLGLQPHPEGGHYREVYRSSSRVQRMADGAERTALTTIYYLLTEREVSRWHRVQSDEVWHFYEGAGLLLQTSPDLQEIHTAVLSTAGSRAKPVLVVPAGMWQSAVSLGDYCLVGCTVGPGFDFTDFEMLPEDSPVPPR